MAKRLKYSRWRRIPGWYRMGEHRPADPNAEPQRLTLYIPAGLLDLADVLSRRAGAETTQIYCEELLMEAIQARARQEKLAEVVARQGPLEGLDEIANDPDYLAEWTASAGRPSHDGTTVVAEEMDGDESIDVQAVATLEPNALPSPAPPTATRSAATEAVLRHAGLAEPDPSGFLATLRRGEPIGPECARSLLAALTELENELRDEQAIDRRLAYALHRLGFEGQVLLTDAWPNVAADQATVDVLRLVQESADRVLSGEDIRYYAQSADHPA